MLSDRKAGEELSYMEAEERLRERDSRDAGERKRRQREEAEAKQREVSGYGTL